MRRRSRRRHLPRRSDLRRVRSITSFMPQPAQADFDAIFATANRWMRAWMEQDQATLEECLAPDFTLIASVAPTHAVDRAQWLAVAPRYVCTDFAYRDVQFRDVGGLVLMSSIA